MNKTNVLMMIVIGLMVLSSGCSQSMMSQTGFLSDYSKLRQDSDSKLSYVNGRDLSLYSSFIVDPVVVHFKKGAKAIEKKSEGKLTQQDMRDLTNYLHSAIVQAIKNSGRHVVYQPGSGVARLRVAITDLEETKVVLAAVPTTRILTGAGVGGAAMEYEVINSMTGEQIAAGVEFTPGSRIPFTGLSQWGGAKAAMDGWAKRVEERLVQVRGL